MLIATIALCTLAQGVPALVVELDATLGGKPYGKLTYSRQIVPGKGLERTVTMSVQDEAGSYTIKELRVYAPGGVPKSVVRTVTEGQRSVRVSVSYSGLTAKVSYEENGETETDTHTLTTEGATLNDPSQFWFFGTAPPPKSEVKYWEFSIDENTWVERKVKYEGEASLKVGDKTIQAYRVSIGADTNYYVDVQGMPYKSVQKTPKGDLVLVRTLPEEF